MPISRSQLVKELEPGLHALFGMEYKRWEREHAEIFTEETSERAFEEETLITGFGAAPTKSSLVISIAAPAATDALTTASSANSAAPPADKPATQIPSQASSIPAAS